MVRHRRAAARPDPLVWMAEVNGILVDLREMPREVQVIAYEMGLIPYVPADERWAKGLRGGSERQKSNASGSRQVRRASKCCFMSKHVGREIVSGSSWSGSTENMPVGSMSSSIMKERTWVRNSVFDKLRGKCSKT
jgi:hypothetical protein